MSRHGGAAGGGFKNSDENQPEADGRLRDDVSFSGLVTYMRKYFLDINLTFLHRWLL